MDLDPARNSPIPSLNHRKRKVDGEGQEKRQDNESLAANAVLDTVLVDPNLPPCAQSHAPRQSPSTSWMTSRDKTEVWPSSGSSAASRSDCDTSDSGESHPIKRPRRDEAPHLSNDSSRRSRHKHGRSTSYRRRRPPYAADTGVMPESNAEALQRLLRSPICGAPISSHIPLDLDLPHIPYPYPLVNRHTLRELDLEAILQNPQLRHDLLFDSGLQFRPVASKRRKRDLSENYWNAVVREIMNGCTCVSFDLQGKPHALVCACKSRPVPPHAPVLAFSSSKDVVTLRMPSRIRPLLSEFLEVLLSVIQPLASISGMYVTANTFQSQMRVHATQAAYLRSHFDPDLIEQELKHGIFDPSGMFRLIGNTLKSHCAPMRDRAVELMVDVAQSCAPGRNGGKAEMVKVFRMCLDILEMMKLDVANHQLQTLRPFLMRASGQFELKCFLTRHTLASPPLTRSWLRTAHQAMLASTHPLAHPLYPSPLVYSTLQQHQQVHISVLKAFTDLVFCPPSCSSTPVSPISAPHSLASIMSPLPGYPETTYLDNTRLLVLSADVADLTALSMYLLLYRQLILSEPTTSPKAKADDADLRKLKCEIRDIASFRLGYCFTRNDTNDGPRSLSKATEEWRKFSKSKQDVILQVAMRAKEIQNRTTPSACSSESVPVLKNAPDERTLKLAERWAESHMQRDSPLSVMLRDRLRDVVFKAVIALSVPGRDALTGAMSTIDINSLAAAASTAELSFGSAVGMEPLAEEIRSLAERISKLSLIHINAYLPLYGQDGFLDL